MSRILVAYAASGFISLAYQVAWFRIFTDRFGSTNFTFALVLTCFIGGLAVGSIASRPFTRMAARLPGCWRELRLYGAVELLVSLSVGITFLAAAVPADLLSAFPYELQDGIWVHQASLRILQGALAAACVFVPCFFMGVTFPLLCDAFRSHPSGARFPAALYAWNTLGACSGVLVCQFLLLPRVGHDATLAGMAFGNVLLGVWFIAAPGSGAQRTSSGVRPRSVSPGAGLRATPLALLVLVAVGGFLSGALEADLFKRITFVIELAPGATMSFISFWAILAIFLASAAIRRLRRLPLWSIKLAFSLAAIYCAVTWHGIDALRDFVEATVTPVPIAVEANLEGMRNLQFPSHLAQLWVFVGILVFPPYFAVSLLLPAVCNEIQRRGGHLGLAYGLNTAAFCGGFLSFVLIVPALGNVFHAFKFFAAVFALCAGWLFLVRGRRPLAPWKPALLVASLAAAWIWIPKDFDRSFFRPQSLPAQYPVRAVRSNGATTTFVVDAMGWPRLFFGRLLMSATNLRARSYMQLMAHFPLLLHPNPEKALLICLGVGNTGGAIASHDGISQIDVVDLNDEVFRTLPEFAAINGALHLDPRVRFIHDDGRSYLKVTHEKYDLITSEPPPPLAAGVYRLYSTDYYREAMQHLTPRGFMTQWLPLFLMTPDTVAMAVSSFLDVFPHTLLFTGYGTDFVLVGSPSPIDLEVVAERFRESPGVVADLAAFNIEGPAALLARIVQDDASLRRNYGNAPRIEDQRNDLELQFLDPRLRPVVRFEVDSVLSQVHEQLAERAPELASRLEAILTHLGRLQYHVQGYPYETLATVDADAAGGRVALADVDWLAVAELGRENTAAIRSGRSDRVIRVLERFLDASEEQPSVLVQLARLRIGRHEYDQAIPLLEKFLALESDSALGWRMIATAYERSGALARALRNFEEAGRLRPDDWVPPARMAWIHATASDPALRNGPKAMLLAERAARLAGSPNPALLEIRAAARAAAGQSRAAAVLLLEALELLPDERHGDRARLERQLKLYRGGGALIDPDR